MKITISMLRQLIREELIREAPMQNPLAVAMGTALANHMKSPEFISAVVSSLGVKSGDPEQAADELITVMPASQMFRQPLYAAADAIAAKTGEQQKAPAQPQQSQKQNVQQTAVPQQPQQ